MMEFFTVSLLNGTVYGLLLFMVSAGLTLIFGMMGVLNFAHTSFYMVGAYLAYSLEKVLGFWPAIIISPRSEEHTSELQSLMRISYAVFCLKKKIQKINKT